MSLSLRLGPQSVGLERVCTWTSGSGRARPAPRPWLLCTGPRTRATAMGSSRVAVRRKAAPGESLTGRQTLVAGGKRYKQSTARSPSALPTAAAAGYTHFKTKEGRWRPIATLKMASWGGIGMVSVGTRRQGRAGDKQVAVPRWSPSPQQVAVPR